MTTNFNVKWGCAFSSLYVGHGQQNMLQIHLSRGFERQSVIKRSFVHQGETRLALFCDKSNHNSEAYLPGQVDGQKNKLTDLTDRPNANEDFVGDRAFLKLVVVRRGKTIACDIELPGTIRTTFLALNEMIGPSISVGTGCLAGGASHRTQVPHICERRVIELFPTSFYAGVLPTSFFFLHSDKKNSQSWGAILITSSSFSLLFSFYPLFPGFC